ncbi:peptidase S8/S53 domain-containing protein [Chlamydoabsidia padenii]|nr:peptidase S8/S53 domain-containing protein [Chlamydoabsidia padenii]
MYFYTLSLILLQLVLVTQAGIIKRDPSRQYYTLHFPQGQTDDNTQQHAQIIARSIGTRYEGQAGELQTYHVVSSPSSHLKRSLGVDPVVASFEQQHKNAHSNGVHKRGLLPWFKVQRIDKQVLRKRSKRSPPAFGKLVLEDAQSSLAIHDPGFMKQWHLINQEDKGHDINVTSVWKQGITGNGTVVAILDDGLDYQSKDLMDNFYAEGSYDFNDHVNLPTPVLWNDYHGTRCAGQIAAARNDACGVGIAYDAKVSGIRILSAEISDVDEAAALNYKYQENDIFSCSWGPPDDGKTMEAPTGILADAFRNGIEKGRGGKGSVFVFATGNGGDAGDNCNFDGYTNSIYTITIGALDHTDHHPTYSEKCSAQLAVTYSSGGGKSIYTTNHGNEDCTNIHGGTSAAAPNAVGIFALVLSVRPDLTWRDMQHLCVQTALPVDLKDDDWKTLPSGRMYNHKYGYGKLDTWAIIEAAKTFQNVNKQTYLEFPVNMNKTAIPDTTNDNKHKKPLQSSVQVTQSMVQAAGLSRLEHVTVIVNIEHQHRGDIQIILSSPNKVESELAAVRRGDASSDGIRNWKFMTVKHWDEDPIGNWTLFVYDEMNADATGDMLNWTMTLFGEMDRRFVGDPIHQPDVNHDTTNNSTTLIIKPTSSLVTSTLSKDPHVPARPTRVKPTITNANSSPDTTPTSYIDEDYILPEGSTTTTTDGSPDHTVLVYGFIGSMLILGLATGIYLFKRKHWRSASLARQYSAATDIGYEFNELKPDEEEDDNDGSSDDRPLLTQR